MKALCTAMLLVSGMSLTADLHAQHAARTTLKVSARVQPVCEIISSDVDLGAAAQGAGLPAGTALVRATCTPNATYNVGVHARTSSGPGIVTGRGTGAAQDHTLFGAVPASEVIPAAERGDTVTLRIYY